MTRAKSPAEKPPGSKRQKGARAIFTDMLREYATKHPDQTTGEVAEAVAQMWLQTDRDLLEEYFVSEGVAILALCWRTDVIRTRSGVYQIVDIPNGHSTALPASITPAEQKTPYWSEKVVRKFAKKLQNLREYDPDARQVRLLLSFNKYALDRSASWDRMSMVHAAWKIDWKIKLAEGLPDDTTTVEEFYTPVQIMTAMEESKRTIVGETNARVLKIKVEPFVKQ